MISILNRCRLKRLCFDVHSSTTHNKVLPKWVATAYVIEDPGAVFKEMYRVLKPNGRAAVTFPFRENFMRFKPVGTEGFYLHKLVDLETAFRDAGFINCKTERNDRVRFGAHCMLGEKPTIN